jgi:hypothetical protein
MPMVSLVSRWAPWIAFFVLALSAATDGQAAARNVAAGLVLSKQDVGRAYSLNRPFTHSWTLAEKSSGLSRPIRKELAAKWVAGAQVGFNGSDSVSHQAVISTADVFRTSAVSTIIGFWRNVYLRNGRGTRLPVPADGPGASRFLMRGHMRSTESISRSSSISGGTTGRCCRSG